MPDITASGPAPSGDARRRLPVRASVERVPLVVSLIAWAALLSYVIPRHEPWADEAQAWQIARSLSLRSLFGHFLHYEGSPGLWHALLWMSVRLHVSYTGMHWVVAGVALIGSALLLFRAPFPVLLRIALIFTYFLAYQYAVVARSYVLIPPLMFLLAVLWPHREQRPFAVAVVLALLANTSAHGIAISAGLAIVLAVECWRKRNDTGQKTSLWIGAAGLWLAAACFAVWCVLPPPDAEWPGGYRQALTVVNFPVIFANLPRLQHGSLTGVPRIEATIGALMWFHGRLSGAFASNVHWGDATWLLFSIRCWIEKRLLYLTPVLLLTVFTSVTKFNVYHGGLFWVLFLFLWWVTWPGLRGHRWNMALTLVVCGCVVSQLASSVQAVRYDAAQAYSPDRDGARVLQRYIDAGQRVDLAVPARTKLNPHEEFFAVGMEPYFAREPIGNMRARFWVWTRDDDMRAVYLRDATAHSAVVLLEDLAADERSATEGAWLQQQGYTRAKAVCGQVFYPAPMGLASRLCHTFYEPPSGTHLP